MPVTRDSAAGGQMSDAPARDAGQTAARAARTLLGFDFGLKRIGVAVGQELTRTASPLTTLKAADGNPDWKAIQDLLQTGEPAALVVGGPCNMDGTEHELTRAALRFARRLEGRFRLPVHRVDERLTSVEAQHIITAHGKPPGRRGKGRRPELDSVAAQVILQNWLDQNGEAHGTNG